MKDTDLQAAPRAKADTECHGPLLPGQVGGLHGRCCEGTHGVDLEVCFAVAVDQPGEAVVLPGMPESP